MKTLITGGCGFIGTNIALREQSRGRKIVIIDDLSKKGSTENLDIIMYNGSVDFYGIKVEQRWAIEEVFNEHPDIDVIFHMAAQTAVTTSLFNPTKDMEVNIVGTMNILENSRVLRTDPVVIYASTNKVYGDLEYLPYRVQGLRYVWDKDSYINGISESQNLDFHSPYGCSKGSADQYVRDYSRVYGLNTIVFRQSCIYGPYQKGHEEQGWLWWIGKCILNGEDITIFGDGRQVRDVMEVSSLLSAYQSAIDNKKTYGQIYNIGGGRHNSISLLEFIKLAEDVYDKKAIIRFDKKRIGDQNIYISDTRKFTRDTGYKFSKDLRKDITNFLEMLEVSK